MKSSIASLLRGLSNIPGWTTKRKLVVIESDDWGSIRMPSKEVFDEIKESGIDLESDEGYLFNKYDALATKDDLESLFNVLYDIEDITGRPAVFTPVAVVANPDFDSIRKSDFSKYYYESVTETLKRYPGCENSFSLWEAGIKNRLFVPQFHGREHLNVKVWMRALENDHKETHIAFKNNFWGLSSAVFPDIKLEFQAAFDYLDPDDLEYHKEVIETGLDLFESLFGYRASYFVPPNGPFSSKLNHVLFSKGIKTIALPKIQLEPIGNGDLRKRINWMGKKTKSGLITITRNCLFEPCMPNRDWIDSCMKDISVAFKYKKPAIISTHRVNYVGSIYSENRDNGLNKLKQLLTQIVKTWPDVEFVTSAELGEMVRGER